MHELPATQGMLQIALETASSVGADRIREIHLVIGDLSSMVDDSVQFYFDLMAQGTAAAGAKLVFHREAAVLRCSACSLQEDVRAPLPPACPRCGDLRVRVDGGQEFRVDSIEVDDPTMTARDETASRIGGP